MCLAWKMGSVSVQHFKDNPGWTQASEASWHADDPTSGQKGLLMTFFSCATLPGAKQPPSHRTCSQLLPSPCRFLLAAAAPQRAGPLSDIWWLTDLQVPLLLVALLALQKQPAISIAVNMCKVNSTIHSLPALPSHPCIALWMCRGA